MESSPSSQLSPRQYKAGLEELYDGGNDIFVYLVETRTCDADVYCENVKKLNDYLKSKKKKTIRRPLSDGWYSEERIYAERKISEFHRYVYVSGILRTENFDPHRAAKQFDKDYRITERQQQSRDAGRPKDDLTEEIRRLVEDENLKSYHAIVNRTYETFASSRRKTYKEHSADVTYRINKYYPHLKPGRHAKRAKAMLPLDSKIGNQFLK